MRNTNRTTSHRTISQVVGASLVLAACGVATDTRAAPDAADVRATRPTTSVPATTTTTTIVPAAARPAGVADSFVQVGTGRMHLRCDGDGDVTVVLIAGFGDGEESWAPILPDLATDTRVCAASRFGTGVSDAPSRDQTFRSEAVDLRAALTWAGEPGPYVVVGHSFGGLQAVAFADAYADEVDGVVLVDTSPTDWITTVCAVPDDGSDATGAYRALCEAISDAGSNPERLDGATGFAEVASIDSLGEVPLIVLTASEHAVDGLDPVLAAGLDRAWRLGQEHLASLSTSSVLVDVGDTGHYIHAAAPGLVVARIQDLLEADDHGSGSK
jgi:pimeloyl-ACP methyl ester carboxylesterase